jgi:hypothetical protein
LMRVDFQDFHSEQTSWNKPTVGMNLFVTELQVSSCEVLIHYNGASYYK